MALHSPASPPPTPSMAAHSPSTENSCPVDGASHPGRWRFTSRLCHHQPRRRRLIARQPKIHSPSTAAHSSSTENSFPFDGGSYPVNARSYPVHAGSYPVHDGSFPLRCRSRCPCFATSYPDAYRRNHCPIDGKSTLHRRRLSPGQRHFYTRPNASPRLHLTLITVIVSPVSFFSFSLAFCPINFPFAPRHQQPYPTAILPHSPSRSIALYLYTSPSSSIYTVRASDSRFTSISLYLSLSTHTNTLTHTSYSWGK